MVHTDQRFDVPSSILEPTVSVFLFPVYSLLLACVTGLQGAVADAPDSPLQSRLCCCLAERHCIRSCLPSTDSTLHLALTFCLRLLQCNSLSSVVANAHCCLSCSLVLHNLSSLNCWALLDSVDRGRGSPLFPLRTVSLAVCPFPY